MASAACAVSAVNIDGATSKDFNRTTGEISDPFDGETAEAAELIMKIGYARISRPIYFYQDQTTFDAHVTRLQTGWPTAPETHVQT
jgi:hypothetical protein